MKVWGGWTRGRGESGEARAGGLEAGGRVKVWGGWTRGRRERGEARAGGLEAGRGKGSGRAGPRRRRRGSPSILGFACALFWVVRCVAWPGGGAQEDDMHEKDV